MEPAENTQLAALDKALVRKVYTVKIGKITFHQSCKQMYRTFNAEFMRGCPSLVDLSRFHLDDLRIVLGGVANNTDQLELAAAIKQPLDILPRALNAWTLSWVLICARDPLAYFAASDDWHYFKGKLSGAFSIMCCYSLTSCKNSYTDQQFIELNNIYDSLLKHK